jgi:hypothetical protein
VSLIYRGPGAYLISSATRLSTFAKSFGGPVALRHQITLALPVRRTFFYSLNRMRFFYQILNRIATIFFAEQNFFCPSSDFRETDHILHGIDVGVLQRFQSLVEGHADVGLEMTERRSAGRFRYKEEIDLAGTTRERTDMKESAGIVISGVDFSVRPEILVRSTDRRGKETYGGVKLLFSKSFPHD